MKMRFNKKYVAIGVVAFCVLACAILFFFMCFQLESFKEFVGKFWKAFTPVLWGCIIAYLFTPITNFIEKKIFFPLELRKKDSISVKKKKFFRVIAIILTYIIIAGLLSLFFYSVIPQVVTSVRRISSQINYYIESLRQWGDNLVTRNRDLFANADKFLDIKEDNIVDYLTNTFFPHFTDILTNISSGVMSAITGVWNFLLGLIISVYVLYSKELFAAQGKKITYCLFERERANTLIKDTRFVSDTFIGFITGKIWDSLIIGIICFICSLILKFPYPVLIAVIVGVTNIIPVFGPFIGAIPSALLILIIDPRKCLVFIIFIIILQQLDGNVIGPLILGDSTGLSAFWVIFSITIFGSLWGVGGMLLGIPFFAVIYAISKRRVERRLKAKGLPTETHEYRPLKRIEEDGSFLPLFEADDSNYKYVKKEKKEKKCDSDAKNIAKSALDRLLSKDATEVSDMDVDTDANSTPDSKN